MAKLKDAVSEPVGNGSLEFVEFAGEEVIGTLHDNQMIFAGNGWDERFHFFDCAELVVAAVDKQFGLLALAQKRKIRAVDGNSQADEMRDARMLATHA